MAYQDKNVIMEDIDVLPGNWRNFSGRQTKFNDAGNRNFCVALEEDIAKAMEADGWNVKWPKPREFMDPDEPDSRKPTLKILVRYSGRRAPVVVVRTSKNRVKYGEDEIEMLDGADIILADMIIRPGQPYHNSDGTTGIPAYLQDLYVTLAENYLEEKYAEIDERERRGQR